MPHKSGSGVVNGKIVTHLIRMTHTQIKQIVEEYKDVKYEVNTITNYVKDNWIGQGKNAFDDQYTVLISKIDDFGDILQEIYDALVDAEAAYGEVDRELKQDFVMSENA